MTIVSRFSDILRRLSQKPSNVMSSSNAGSESSSDMDRCLTTLDLIMLGLGTLTGANLYMFPNRLAHMAGAAGIVSLAITTLVTLTTGLHYAELATKLPNTSGSIYMYIYYTLGELMAVIIGWSLIAQYMIGACYASIGFSAVVNAMFDGCIDEYGRKATDSLGFPHIDFLAAFVFVVVTGIIASGVDLSISFVKFMNVLTAGVLVFFFVVSFWLGTEKNWEDSGFVPFGFQGIVTAIPMSYYAICGFDTLACTGDECKTPNKSIPIALFVTVIVGGFFLTALPVLFITYDLPLKIVPHDNGILEVFGPLGYPYVKYIMGIGAITSLSVGAFASLYPSTRVTYAIAKQKFLFEYFEKINPRTHTPVRATIVCGILAVLLAALMDLNLLMGFGVLTSLTCYVFAVAATLVLRYQEIESYRRLNTSSFTPDESSSIPSRNRIDFTYSTFNKSNLPDEDVLSSKTKCLWIRSKFRPLQILSLTYFKTFLLIIHLFIILCCVLVAVWRRDFNEIPHIVIAIFGLAVIFIVFLLAVLLSLPQQPKETGTFRSPLIPYISFVTTTINIYFMTLFDLTAWLFYIGWVVFGLFIYFIYGYYLSRKQHQTSHDSVGKRETTSILSDERHERFTRY